MGEDEIPMKSRSIETVCYREKEQTLQVRLRDGRAYRYHGVPKKAYHGLTQSLIHIKYLNSEIAAKFEATEILGEGAAETEHVRIQNFRSILDMTVGLGDLTMLIGTNGTGKTTVLEAIGLFGPGEPGISYDDIGRGLDQANITLSIKVCGSGVPDRFLTNGMIELRRTFTESNPGKPTTQVAAMLNRDFDGIRNAANGATRDQEIKKAQEKYPDLPADAAMEGWESKFAEYEHKLSLDPKYRDMYAKKFIGFSKAEIDLSKILEVVVVPTTRNIVDDAGEGEGSNLSRLMDLAISSSEKRVRELRTQVMTLDEADKHTHPFRDVIRDLNGRLGYNSKRYMTGAEFTVDLLLPDHRQPDVLKASVRMKDNEFMEDMARAGSGAQRVYLLSLLDTIADLTREAQKRDPEHARASPVRLIAIDEPELYQHPQRQRRMLRSLEAMAKDPAVRIVCSTHSPYFVRLKSPDKLRILRRGKKRICSTTRERLVGLMLSGDRSVEDGWREVSRRLDMSVTRWVTEGFFARHVVITEGPGDRNMLLAAASAMGVDLERKEITIVPAESVNNIEKFIHLFREFGIPTYVIWDIDNDQFYERNQRLAHVASGGTFTGNLDKTTINKNFACVEDNMTETLARELYNCAEILRDNRTYQELERERVKDEDATNKKSQKCHNPRRDAFQKTVWSAQKRFLNDRPNVTELLGAVGKKNPKKLESFTLSRIVRYLQDAAESS